VIAEERLRVKETDINGGRNARLFSCFQLTCGPSMESVLFSKSSF
jgi:hypothetical protein